MKGDIDSYFMKLALDEAEISLKTGDWPIGCVIVMNNIVIATGRNEVYSLKDKMAHAEKLTLEKAQKILYENRKIATLYTTYEPCPMCFGAAILSRVKRVVSGVDLDQSGAMYFREHLPILFKQDNWHVDFTDGVLADECARVFMKSEHVMKLNEKGLLRKVIL